MMVAKSLLTLHQETVTGLSYKKWAEHKYLQFSGLTDKDGIEIYAGDVIKVIVNPNRDSDMYGTESVFYVEVEETAWGYDFSWTHISGYECSTHIMESPEFDNVSKPNYQVIGNIYENPELLNN